MGLDLEYFKNQTHITDLQKLNENELKFIIRLLEDELEEFNINDGFEVRDIINTCNKTLDLLNNFIFILHNYIRVVRKNDLFFCNKRNTMRLITDIYSIIDNLKKIKAVRISKEKINDLVDTCLLNLRAFYDSINDYITEEYNIWEKEESENS